MDYTENIFSSESNISEAANRAALAA